MMRHWRYVVSSGDDRPPYEPLSDWAVIDGANIDDAAMFVAENLEPDDGTWIYFREVDSPYTFRVQVCRAIRWQVGKYEKVEMKPETKETKVKLDANQIILVSEDELKWVKELAEAEGLSASDYIRVYIRAQHKKTIEEAK